MKITKISAAVAAACAVSSASAQFDYDSIGHDNVSAGVRAGACAIIADTRLTDGLRTIQGIDTDCQGNNHLLCAPSISSAELRALVTDAIVNASLIENADGDDLAANSGIKKGALNVFVADGCDAALTQFVSASETIAGFACGAGPVVAANNRGFTNASVLTTIDANSAATHQIGVVAATSMTQLQKDSMFMKLDGVAPSLTATASSNYNLIANLDSGSSTASHLVKGITVGTVAAGSGSGVAWHNAAGSSTGCGPLSTHDAILDVSGGVGSDQTN